MIAVRKALIASTVALIVAAVLAPSALAAQQYQDSVSGVEVSATSTEGVFAGTASGDLPGLWAADVLHTPLSGSPESATITGGTFDLLTQYHNHYTDITGTFSGGSVVQTAGFTGCVDQVYAVTGQLVDVGILGKPDHGTGAFDATLIHHRILLNGNCVIYAA